MYDARVDSAARNLCCKIMANINQAMICVLCAFILCLVVCMGVGAVAIGMSDLECGDDFELPESKDTKEEEKIKP